HLPAVHVHSCGAHVVGPAAVHVGCVVVGLLASTARHGRADRRHAVVHGDAVGTGIGPEVAVEGPVLLLDDDDVLDLVDPRRHDIAPGRTAADELALGRGWLRAAARR